MQDILSRIPCMHKIGTYKFTQANCPRCQGTGFYHDLALEVTGEVKLVSGSNRLLQDVEKALVDKQGTHPEDSAWGSQLYNAITRESPSLTRAQIVSSVIDALKRLRYLGQLEDMEYNLPVTEKIARQGIGDISVFTDSIDPRRVELRVVVVSEARSDVVVKTPVSI